MSYFGVQDNFIFKIVLLDRFDCSFFQAGPTLPHIRTCRVDLGPEFVVFSRFVFTLLSLKKDSKYPAVTVHGRFEAIDGFNEKNANPKLAKKNVEHVLS